MENYRDTNFSCKIVFFEMDNFSQYLRCKKKYWLSSLFYLSQFLKQSPKDMFSPIWKISSLDEVGFIAYLSDLSMHHSIFFRFFITWANLMTRYRMPSGLVLFLMFQRILITFTHFLVRVIIFVFIRQLYGPRQATYKVLSVNITNDD